MLASFHDILPDIAEREIRSLRTPGNERLPAGEYALQEFFCPKAGCDCRRVSLQILRRGVPQPEAMISHAFVGGDLDATGARTYLDPLHRQAPHAPALLDLVEELLEHDVAWAQRLERHYALAKQAVADPDHPCQQRLAQSAAAPLGARGEQLRPGTVGTRANPMMLRVQDEGTGARMAAVADEMNIHYLLEIAPGKPVDVSDMDFVGRDRGPPAHLSRHERRAWEKRHRRR